MGKSKTLKNLIGKIKDKASQGKAAVVHVITPTTQSLHLAILKSTTHSSHSPPDEKYVAALLSFCGSRRVPTVFAAAAWRLRATRDACVATKCLIVLHRLIRPKDGCNRGICVNDCSELYLEGPNNLKMNDFRDRFSYKTLELSSWIRWYAQYLDCLSSISRVMKFFPDVSASSEEKEMERHRVLFYKTGYILRQIDALVSLFEHICLRPESPPSYQNKIVDEIRELVGQDYFPAMRLIMTRFEVVSERLVKRDADFSGSVQLARTLVRLEECKERLIGFSHRYKVLVEDFWDMVWELKCKVLGSGKMLVSSKTHEMRQWVEPEDPVQDMFDEPVQLNVKPVRFSFVKAFCYERISV